MQQCPFELYITLLSGSVALPSDALHNLGAVFTTVGVYFGFRDIQEAADSPLPVWVRAGGGSGGNHHLVGRWRGVVWT